MMKIFLLKGESVLLGPLPLAEKLRQLRSQERPSIIFRQLFPKSESAFGMEALTLLSDDNVCVCL
jgi:hypothetical protein